MSRANTLVLFRNIHLDKNFEFFQKMKQNLLESAQIIIAYHFRRMIKMKK
jgi:hypothetical protein